ncbi:MAG: exonuclease SbcCD subunit D [Lachnospiraceae bacterium]|nr:exonuclease SbcCD subunit D [Lachnospiraceae bacterium]MBQ2320262.1 exonuclease SbcCD subunit D [Lachnospiraceae bacterium]
MKMMHLSDLHFGRQLHGYDISDLQQDVIEQFVNIIEEEKPDVVLISGDIYDKTIPSAQAMTLLDDMLVRLEGTPVLIIAGNHDSAERLKFGQSFLQKHNIHISVMPPQSEEERLKKVVLEDEYGKVNFYLMPFIKPGMVRHFMPEEAAEGEEKIIEKFLEKENIDESERNVILSHQFYINCGKNPECSDSEKHRISVGTSDSVEISVIGKFDYAALGHIHKAQSIGDERFRYCGTPLKYSVSESKNEKSVTIVTLGEKSSKPDIKTVPLYSKRNVAAFKGTFDEIKNCATEENKDDYVSITLTDEVVPDDVKQKLGAYFNNILEVNIDNVLTRNILSEDIGDFKELTPFEAFQKFFENRTGNAMNEEEIQLIKEIIDEI